jgi:hypothetical protein
VLYVVHRDILALVAVVAMVAALAALCSVLGEWVEKHSWASLGSKLHRSYLHSTLSHRPVGSVLAVPRMTTRRRKQTEHDVVLLEIAHLVLRDLPQLLIKGVIISNVKNVRICKAHEE